MELSTRWGCCHGYFTTEGVNWVVLQEYQTVSQATPKCFLAQEQLLSSTLHHATPHRTHLVHARTHRHVRAHTAHVHMNQDAQSAAVVSSIAKAKPATECCTDRQARKWCHSYYCNTQHNSPTGSDLEVKLSAGLKWGFKQFDAIFLDAKTANFARSGASAVELPAGLKWVRR